MEPDPGNNNLEAYPVTERSSPIVGDEVEEGHCAVSFPVHLKIPHLVAGKRRGEEKRLEIKVGT